MAEERPLPFTDRADAGRALAQRLMERRFADPIILALPRGGVPVAAEIARKLNAPLDLLLVRKIGVPYQRELAVAAVLDGSQPQIVVDETIRERAGVDPSYIHDQAKIELSEIERRRTAYLRGRAPLPVQGKTAIVVDDGIATGTTMRAALKGLRRLGPAKIVLAVPVAPRETIERLRAEADEIICLAQPDPFGAIGYFYRDFHPLRDSEVVRALAEAAAIPPEN
ncbi:MAG: phosphoribosyltransferase [Planctomycetes bacterium]|nr:phosphoribosyltransferase [Planctomycetota bacterium]